MAGPILQPIAVTEWGVRPPAAEQTIAERVDSLLCANMNDVSIHVNGEQMTVVFAMDDSSRLAVSVRGDEVIITTAMFKSTEGAH